LSSDLSSSFCVGLVESQCVLRNIHPLVWVVDITLIASRVWR
jgi:hypothetical protein